MMHGLSRSAMGAALALLIGVVAPADAASGEPQIETVTIPAGGMDFTALAAGPQEGEPVLLLHGFPQTSHAYRGAMRMLALAGFRAVAPDQRGYSPGARPAAVEDYRVGKLIDDVVAIADALQMSRFHLVGHDWGGAVAWGVAGRYPNRVLSLTVLSTPHPGALGRARRSSDQNERSGYMVDFAADDAERRLLADDAASLRRLLPSPPIAPADRDVYLEALGTPGSLRGALNWYRALLRTPAAPAANASDVDAAGQARRPPVTVPTLYIWGTEDPVFSPEAARATGDFVFGPYTFHALESVGHWVMEQAGDRVDAALLAHLARFSGGAPGLDTRGNYDRARRVLGRALEAAGGRRSIQRGFPIAARYEGVSLANGQSPTPDQPPERLQVAGAFVVDRRGRVYMERQLVNVGGTDRSFRRVIEPQGGWNEWVARQLHTRMTPVDVAFLRGTARLFPPRALPHAVLEEAAQQAGSLRWLGMRHAADRPVECISYSTGEGITLTLLVDADDGRLAAIEQMGTDFERGDVVFGVRYEEQQMIDGLPVPRRVSFLMDAEPLEMWTLSDIRLGESVDLGVFDPPPIELTEYPPSLQPQAVAENVWALRLYSGPANSYSTMIVAFDTYVAVLDAPLVDILYPVVARVVAGLAPGKPIRYVIPTHAHFDHIGGIRAYLAAGATAIATPRTAAFLRRLSEARLTVRPDPLAGAGHPPSIETFRGERTLRDGTRELHLYDLGPTPHSEEIVVAYLPDEKVLFVSDLFALPENGRLPPSTRTFETFVDRILALGLEVETVVAGHGLVATWSDVLRTVR